MDSLCLIQVILLHLFLACNLDLFQFFHVALESFKDIHFIEKGHGEHGEERHVEDGD